MADQDTPTLRKVAWTELLPWLNLVRCFRIAIQIRLLLCGALGALLTVIGWWILGLLFSANERVNTVRPVDPWKTVTSGIPDQAGILSWQGAMDFSMIAPEAASPAQTVAPLPTPTNPGSSRTTPTPGLPETIASLPDALYQPLIPRWGAPSSVEPFYGTWRYLALPWNAALYFPQGSGRLGWYTFALFAGLWALAVWALFGGMITRAAAIELATYERAKTVRTVRFAAGKWRAYFAAPFFPMIGVLAIGIPVAILGLFLHSGPTIWVAAILWPLALVAGFLMAMLLLGLLFGWPLMFANISVEGVDSFDAVGRAYNYVFQRPLQYLFYAIVAGVLGALGWLLVWNFTAAIVGLTYGAAAWGGSATAQAVATGSGDLGVMGASGAALIRFWAQCVKLLGVGFLFSYFWTASTAIYYLLRRDADAAELDQVCPEEEEQPAESAATIASGPDGTAGPQTKLPADQAE